MNLPEDFNHGLRFVLKSEGGISHDPKDMGGLTKYGISTKSYPEVQRSDFTLNDAIRIYYRDYWLKQSCDHFSTQLATFIFDCSVNCGRYRTGKWMQEIINKNTQVVKVDGIIGLNTVLATRGKIESNIVMGMAGKRAKHYSNLIKEYPEQVRFIRGWNNRLGDLLLYII